MPFDALLFLAVALIHAWLGQAARAVGHPSRADHLLASIHLALAAWKLSL